MLRRLAASGPLALLFAAWQPTAAESGPPSAAAASPAPACGPLCVAGEWPDLVFTPSDPFEIRP